MIARLAERAVAAAEGLLALALAAVVAMVFGNVVLRYLFDSGIAASEELSRFLFVWLVFLGAVAVARRGGHLGFDLVARALPPAGRRACRIASDALVVLCCGVLFAGAWSQTLLNLGNAAPVSGVPLGWSYAAAVAAAAGLGLAAAADLFAALRGRDPPPPPAGRDAEPGA